MPGITLWLHMVWSHSARHNPPILCSCGSWWASRAWVICTIILQTGSPLVLSTNSCRPPPLKTASHNSHFALQLDVLPSEKCRLDTGEPESPQSHTAPVSLGISTWQVGTCSSPSWLCQTKKYFWSLWLRDFMAFKKLFNEFGGICIRVAEGKISEGVKLNL